MQLNDARIIRGAALFTAVAGVLALVAGSLTAGVDGAVGVGLGTLVGGLFFASGQIVLARQSQRRPELLTGIAGLVYVTHAGVLLALLVVLRDASFLHGRPFAAGVIVAMVAWLVGQIRGNLKAKTPYVVIEPETAPATGSVSPPDAR